MFTEIYSDDSLTQTPLTVASITKNNDLAKLLIMTLLVRGVNVDEFIKFLNAPYYSEDDDEYSMKTALIIAIKSNNPELATFLINKAVMATGPNKAKLNEFINFQYETIQDPELGSIHHFPFTTPLDFAIIVQNEELIKLLRDNGGKTSEQIIEQEKSE